ncbi:MAG: ribonuclease H-like domain-containing protein [Candidatus Micrarchaeota archaeon]|nr:ribonuclease H-like domain-containing protein [Candidatus Micrarchaeota archaeon]MDE1847903.1 ribonuclease H-like domain-containing protein [Candidatus Micrarchaeota archaeon]MDE1864529.1 ribonuclease H-like domain-containing protein [Candidatus Micrarchaeota archaeon]
MELRGTIIDADFSGKEAGGSIRITLKSQDKSYQLFDPNFRPYFYIVPSSPKIGKEALLTVTIAGEEGEEIKAREVLEERRLVWGKDLRVFKIYLDNPRSVPKLSRALEEFGTCYENDIVFWKRYLIDKNVPPMSSATVQIHDEGGRLVIDHISSGGSATSEQLSCICFDIETYNPLGIPNRDKDPVIMISYTDGIEYKVLTTKKINREFVRVFENEKEMIKGFVDVVRRIDPDVISGYNSSNFDLPYLMKRAEKLGLEFAIGRQEGEIPKIEHHGLVEAVRIPGRAHVDLYHVAKFVSVVGASEKVIKVNSFKLYEVYHAVTGKDKKMVDKPDIWKLWDRGGEELEELTDYSLADSLTLKELYDFFMPLEIEMSKVSGTTLGEASLSTTSQLVEFMLMRYAQLHGQMIPNKPGDGQIGERMANPYEGAYVKTPDAGIYENIVVLDFRGLYPSIIIAHNIDPSTLCTDCTDFFEAPNGAKFTKQMTGIMPLVLKLLIDERAEAKRAYKKDPDNKELSARSTALKVLANAFYGYLGYARSRWYSRESASAVTAYARFFITQTIEKAEAQGFKVLYSDTDSIFLVMEKKTKEDADKFLKSVNAALPNTMELELEDFYTRGVFVGKRGSEGGAKKKYALMSESGRIKIKGFELVRRDWSKIARDTQRAVLEAILKEGSKEKAVGIVKDVVERLKSGKVELKELVMNTQLRKGIGNYDIKSPELAAARKAVEKGIRKKSELVGTTIGYVITRHGSSISEKAEILELADDYDPDYYIDHQIIPSTLKILKELGYNADELRMKGSQKKLGR